MRTSLERKQIFEQISVKLEQKPDFSIIVNQKDYTESINLITSKHLKHKLSEVEATMFRGILGKLYWVAGTTRPKISFFVYETSTRIKNATVSDLISANKVIKFLETSLTYTHILAFHLNSLIIKLYSDARFNNLPSGGYQGRYLALICDKYSNIAYIA